MMLVNPSICQLMLVGLGHEYRLCMEIDKMILTTVQQVKLLSYTTDSKLKLDEHAKSLCITTNRLGSAFSRAPNVVDPAKCKLLCNSMILSNFKYCIL